MGREVRKVPKDWKHPIKFYQGSKIKFIPLREGVVNLDQRMADWDKLSSEWNSGLFPSYADEEDKKMSYEEWDGPRPDPKNYMPAWKEEEKTHYMMYEDTSEGTPISPAFSTPEELARWLVDNNASSFAKNTSDYESWLAVAKGRFAPSLVIAGGVMMTCVDMAGSL
jgi:hypothetical protein